MGERERERERNGETWTRNRVAKDIKLPTFDRISDCARLEFHTGLNGIPFTILPYRSGGVAGIYFAFSVGG